MKDKNIAIVGGGIAGLSAAHALHTLHTANNNLCHITIFEQATQMGGHAHTIDITHDGQQLAVDAAFMVYNERNYPIFCKLLETLNIQGEDTDMSFSVVHDMLDITYNGGSVAGLIADKRNLLRGCFWKLLAEVIRFNRIGKKIVRRMMQHDSNNQTIQQTSENAIADETLQQFLMRHRFADIFCDAYLLPMGASIWSCSPSEFANAPAQFVLSFFNNHGLLDLYNRPQWRCIKGGSRCYVNALINSIPNLHCRHNAVHRVTENGEVQTDNDNNQFDAVIIAAHAPQALAMLSTPTKQQQEILSAFRYTQTEGALHTDSSLLPSKEQARAAWNYRVMQKNGDIITYPTYWLSRLQKLSGRPLLLTLNIAQAQPNPQSIIEKFTFSHPLPDIAAMKAQRRFAELNRIGKIYFCGAYWGNGFHEDGAHSGQQVADFVLQNLS